jgi:hypothetical protein
MSDGQSGCANEQREIIRGIDNTPTRRVIISFGRKECKNYALSDDLGPGSKRGAINEPELSRCGLFGIYRDRSIDREGAEPPVDYAQPPDPPPTRPSRSGRTDHSARFTSAPLFLRIERSPHRYGRRSYHPAEGQRIDDRWCRPQD